MNIIVKKTASHAMFRPHFNSSLNKFYRTKDDYLGDLKRMKLEPYREIERQASKPYNKKSLDSNAMSMIQYASQCEKTERMPSEKFINALNELGIAKKPKWLTDAESLVGGFKGEVND